MVDRPASCAACGEGKVTSPPSNSMRPESLERTPVSTLIRVDLPAPFCPISACTSPRATSRWASVSAATPRNALLTPCIDNRGGGPSATAELPFSGLGDGARGRCHPRAHAGVVTDAPVISVPVRATAQYALSTLADALSLVN